MYEYKIKLSDFSYIIVTASSDEGAIKKLNDAGVTVIGDIQDATR